MKMIPNTNNALMLAVPVYEADKCTDVAFVPVIGWTHGEYNELRVWALGVDNDKDEQKIIFNVDNGKFYVLNKQITGSGKEELLYLIKLNKEIEIKI